MFNAPLPSEILSLKYDAPHQRMTLISELDGDFQRREVERITEYYERDRDDYERQGEFTYSNPISI